MAKKQQETYVRVSETSEYAEAFPQHIKLEDYQNVDLIIDAVSITEGDKASYVVFEGRFLEDPDQPLIWSCGGRAILRYFSNGFNAEQLPLIAAFYQGEQKMWMMR